MATNLVKEQVADALLHSVSYNLRTPLTCIRGTLSYLQQSEAYRHDGAHGGGEVTGREGPMRESQPDVSREAREELIGNAVAEAERLNRYIGNLIDLARLESGTVQFGLAACQVDDLIGTALDLVRESLRGRRVQVRVAADLPAVAVDFAWMLKALLHVLDNATRYSPPGSPIQVRAQATAKHLEISVADRGVGISPRDLRRVFGRFYGVDGPERGTGTGVGLAICKAILAAHAGTIRAENRKGGGTVITMRIPASPPPAPAGGPTSVAVASPEIG